MLAESRFTEVGDTDTTLPTWRQERRLIRIFIRSDRPIAVVVPFREKQFALGRVTRTPSAAFDVRNYDFCLLSGLIDG